MWGDTAIIAMVCGTLFGLSRSSGTVTGRYANLSLRDVARCLASSVFFFSREPVAQLVEHRTFNAVVAGSSPARLTIIFSGLGAIPKLSGTNV